MKNKFTLVVFLLVACALFSQEPITIHLTEKDGLPDIEFYDVLEDKKGFIWFAADNGLFRYDGKEYKNYSHPKKRGLSVFNLQEDNQGRIWTNNVSGQFFYVEKDSLHLFIDINEKLKTTRLPEYEITPNGKIHIAMDRGWYEVDFSSKELKEIKAFKEDLEAIPSIIKYKESLFYLDSVLYQVKKGKASPFLKFEDFTPYRRLFKFDDNLFLIASREILNSSGEYITENSFFKIDVKTKKTIEIPTPKELYNRYIVRISYIDNNVWICTTQGVYVYQLVKGAFIYEKEYFKKEYTTKVVRDLNGNYWVGTLKNGVYIIPNIGINKYDVIEEYSSITSLEFVEDYFIYGTDKGKLVINRLKEGVISVIDLGAKIKVNKIKYNRASRLLFISCDLKSFIWDLNSNKLVNTYAVGSKELSMIGQQRILSSTYGGAFIHDYSNYKTSLKKGDITKKPKLIEKKIFNAKEVIQLESVRGHANYFSKDSSIYLSQIDKLLHLDSDLKRTEITYLNNSIFATDITETADEFIWITTNQYGVLGIKDQKIVSRYDTSKGLQSNQASKITADGNNLWITTEKGLHYLDRSTGLFKNFSFRNEIPIQKVIDLKMNQEKLFVSGNKGIVIIDKRVLLKDSSPPKIYFESIIIGEKEKEEREEYQISYNENSFEVFFNANGFNSNESMSYSYRLAGLEKEWKQTSTGNIRYPSLPYGTYVFEVKATNSKGVESELVKTIKIEVTTPFWKQGWFYVLLVLIGSLYLTYMIRKGNKKQKEKLENERVSKELVFSQLENLRSQMNPHFIFNVLNSIQEYIITNDKYTASLYLAEFSKLIRMYLDHSRQEKIRLSQEIKALKIYLELEKNRFEEDFKYAIHIAENVNLEKTYIPSLFIQPYIENSIKHGLLHKNDSKVLLVDFKYDDFDNALICNIVDNGIGRESSKKINEKREGYHASFATKANSNRVLLLNKNRERKIIVKTVDLFTDQMKSKGTKITIQIPQ